MNNMHLLNQRVETMHGRLSELYKSVNVPTSSPSDLLPIALKELGVASEELQVVVEELTEQNARLAAAQYRVEAERQRYQELFEFAPDGYLVTDTSGTIREVNRAAAELLSIQQRFLVGKPLVSLVYFDDRLLFRTKLAQLAQRDRTEVTLRLQRRQSDLFEASLSIDVIRNQEGESLGLRWLLRDVTERKRAEAALMQPSYNPCQDRPLHYFKKGDIIPLEPQALWLVSQGIVKLTTLSECGTEMLVGLLRESSVFGSSLTALHTYQAVALTDAQLASIPLTEIAQSPRLAQALLPMINQRLRQTESFLAVYGQIRVEDRLNCLLLLLKQTIGHPVDKGIRLSVRLTHQDFASACCTTRVTITRLLGKLQQQGKVFLDAQSHLVLAE
jgi:PAS domain S-box-containing protein